jgi:hypothetical protein
MRPPSITVSQCEILKRTISGAKATFCQTSADVLCQVIYVSKTHSSAMQEKAQAEASKKIKQDSVDPGAVECAG